MEQERAFVITGSIEIIVYDNLNLFNSNALPTLRKVPVTIFIALLNNILQYPADNYSNLGEDSYALKLDNLKSISFILN